MASTTCPKCRITLSKGSWELYTHCPSCGEQWNVDSAAPARNLKRVKRLAVFFTLLTVIPYAGVVFGILGIWWGFLAVKFRYVVLGTTLMVISGVIGLAC